VLGVVLVVMMILIKESHDDDDDDDADIDNWGFCHHRRQSYNFLPIL